MLKRTYLFFKNKMAMKYPETTESTEEVTEKLKLHEKIIVSIILIIITGSIGVAIAANMGPSNSLDDMTVVYQRMQDEIKSLDALRASKVETCKLQEVSLAKRKLEMYYSDESKLSVEDRDRLLLKAEGQNLTCGGSF